MLLLVRELGGVSIEYTARVSESPWAAVHFTVRMPDGSRPEDVDVSLDNETRIQNLLTEAARTWADRLMGAVKDGSIDQDKAEHYASAFPEDYKQWATSIRTLVAHWVERYGVDRFAADLAAWLAEQLPLPGYGPCRVPVCTNLADSPLGLCPWHTSRYYRDKRPGRARLPSSWWHRYEQFGRPIPIEYADEAAFRGWCASTPAPFWPVPSPNSRRSDRCARCPTRYGRIPR